MELLREHSIEYAHGAQRYIEQKMKVITKTFNELYDKNHPVRQNLYYMGTIEEIRIIKGLS